MHAEYHVETFTPEEQGRLAPHVTNLDRPVFGLVNLPQITAAALFARYSRSSKSLRRLLLDEFLAGDEVVPTAADAGRARASDLFGRVLAAYGDDSVAQLAGVHLACEQVSQPLAKAIEWGRLGAYLEQSTRYIPYTDRRDGHYRYLRDRDVLSSALGPTYVRAMDGLFETYAALREPLSAHLDETLAPEADEKARKRAIRALALDLMRGLLPAGTVSNVGVFASPQAYEQLVMRLRAHPLPEAQAYAELVNAELQEMIPDFLTRLDRPERGGAWVDYLRDTAAALGVAADALSPEKEWGPPGVTLVDWDADGEDQILAAALFPYSHASEERLLAAVRPLDPVQRARLFVAAVGDRGNRRHRPGRGFEHCDYTFEVISDYGAFRDLQRHRMLTVQWQELTPSLGYDIPPAVDAAGLTGRWREAVATAEVAHKAMAGTFPQQAGYLVTLGHRVRYLIKLNAREAVHLIELRTSPQGHPSYRQICQEMLRLIDEVAGHHLVAGTMRFAGSDDVHLPRYAAEARSSREDGEISADET
ncbi:MAG TPA: FAD-dependent thymidylate synthase [Candidatus Acidoferrales bacterium]|nr:FAD-dependent thymidylate synthase [Candidatus Acidoferrales bacterium]